MLRCVQSEIVLATLPAACDDERLQVVLVRQHDGKSVIALLQQSWAEGVGWFTQHALQLAPDQVRQLRSVLGAVPGASATKMVTSYMGWDGQDDDSPRRPDTIPFPTPSRRAESA